MSMTLIIIIIEILVVLLAVVGALLYLRWKTQKAKTVEFDGLLTTFENQVEERKTQLIFMLKESYKMEAEGAEESASYMIEAEKQFLQEFLKQQIENTPVNEFYLHLSELLDQYLYFVPKLNNEKENKNIEQTLLEESVEEDALEKDVDIDESENTTESDETEININVAEVMVDAENKLDAGLQTDSKDSEPKQDASPDLSEPDWGEAFAESGDEVDKDTEAAFEAEKNKN